MLRFTLIVVSGFFFCNHSIGQSYPSENSSAPQSWQIPNATFYRQLNLAGQSSGSRGHVNIAIIDVGFRTTHKSIRPFIYLNPTEIADNHLDDDGNGFPDDINGWDVADEDNDVSVIKGLEDRYYHGTYIASIIVSVIEQILGPDASKYVSIVPVKATSDINGEVRMRDGYKGFEYARAVGADIICCAWAGGIPSGYELTAVREAVRSGIGIIAAAGNYMTDQVALPAAITGVLAVAAVDSNLQKTQRSNYGMRVDVSAPGQDIFGAHPMADNAFIRESGTSAATAIVTGVAAALKVLNPKSTGLEMLDAIRYTAQPIDQINLSYAGKLGSGIPDFSKALKYLLHPEQRTLIIDSTRPKGILIPQRGIKSNLWTIHPAGAYKGMKLSPALANDVGQIDVRSGNTLLFSGSPRGLAQFPIFEGGVFTIEYQGSRFGDREQRFKYAMEPIDSAKLYCSEKKVLYIDKDGIIEDGSGEYHYTNRCECTWQLIAPAGKRISIEMLEMDTEPLVDNIWFFDGITTHPERLIAKISGNGLPRIIESQSNQMLLWFVSDKVNTGQGFRLRYKVLDK